MVIKLPRVENRQTVRRASVQSVWAPPTKKKKGCGCQEKMDEEKLIAMIAAVSAEIVEQ